MKLISMVDFVLDTKNNLEIGKDFVEVVCSYTKFLNQPLTLGMFVPCDEDGNVLNEKEWKQFEGRIEDCSIILEKHKQAKECILFEGFNKINYPEGDECIYGIVTNGEITLYPEDFKKIEDLVKYNLTLTPNAIK